MGLSGISKSRLFRLYKDIDARVNEGREQPKKERYYLPRKDVILKSIIPKTQKRYHDDWHFSPGLEESGFIFLSGATGGNRKTGEMPEDIASQARNAFETLGEVLLEAGLDFNDVIDITTYHVGLQEQLDLFGMIKDEYIALPYPTWTAIGVTELASQGAHLEIKMITRKLVL